MQRNWTPAHCLTVAILIGAGVHAADNAAQSLFDELYKARIDAVTRTLSKDDDVQLAKELFVVTSQESVDENLLILLCESAYELGMRSKDGYATAVNAMRTLADRSPTHRSAARIKLLDAMNRQYLSVSGDERNTLGEALVDQYIEIGDAQVKAGAPDEAVKLYRKAALAAGRIRSPKIADAKARIEWAIARQRTQRNIERLEQALLRDATDIASAKTLALIYLTEMDDPATAAKYAPRSGDNQLKAITPLAAKPFPQLTPAELLKLGVWYQSLAAGASANQRTVVMTNAQKYLSRFIELGRGSNLEKTKAKLLLSSVKKELEKATRSGRPTLKPPSTSKQVKYFPIENIKKAFRLDDNWVIQGNSLKGTSGDILGVKPRLKVPFKAKTFRYGFKIKAKWYHCAYVKFMNRGSNVSFVFVVGFFENTETTLRGPNDLFKFKGNVSKPNEWHLIEIELTGSKQHFYYDGQRIATYTLLHESKTPEQFAVGFGSHKTGIQVKDFFLIADGKSVESFDVPE